MKESIIVNATALDKSGALSILRQFVENIPDDRLDWLVFIPNNINLTSEKRNVRLEPIDGVKPMFKRFLWDIHGLNRWLKKSSISPIACISLQNTGFRVLKKDIPKFIYYHQPLPFFSYKWNFFKKGQRILWFYKNIYPIFVNLFLSKNTTVYTQLEFIKHGFEKRFRHPSDRVKVFSPSVSRISSIDKVKFELSESINLFYPATGHFYKNHTVLYDVMKIVGDKAHLYVTTPSKEKNVTSIGVIPFEQVCTMYRQCDALVFPSFIETYGLPLLEAAQTGIPIIVADLPYAHEVLNGYGGATFVKYDDSYAWANAIGKLKKGERFAPINISNRPGWKELFNDIMLYL